MKKKIWLFSDLLEKNFQRVEEQLILFCLYSWKMHLPFNEIYPGNIIFFHQDYLGDTPIHKAAKRGNMECVSLLISQGASLW